MRVSISAECRVAASPRRHVVVTAGNHDSPSFLDAPRELLKFLNIHVVGCASDSAADEVMVIKRPDGPPGALLDGLSHPGAVRLVAEAGDREHDVELELSEKLAGHGVLRNVVPAFRRAVKYSTNKFYKRIYSPMPGRVKREP